MVIGFLLILVLSSVLLGISIHPGSISDSIYIDNQDMVLLGYFDTYYYGEVQVHKAQDNQCLECKIEVYVFYPDRLIVADKHFNESSGILTSTHDDVLLPPKYYVSSGSFIKVFVEFFPTAGQNSSVEFLIFNEFHQYDAFRRGDKPDPYEIYSIRVTEKEKYFSLLFEITITGYYFIGIRPIEMPVTFQSTLTIHQIYYSRANFPPPMCVIDSTSSCTVQFTPSSTNDYTDTRDMCVLVYSVPPQQIAPSYYVNLDYNVSRGFWTNSSKALVCLIGLSVLLVLTPCFYCFGYSVLRSTARRWKYKQLL